ncbi:MAG: SLC13 family permease [Spirochaetes bacterium]|nr:SLC13 family permease [Spirochaetota bacterium]
MFSAILYIVFALMSIAIVIYLTYRFRLNPFYILVPVSLILSMIIGTSPANTISTVKDAFARIAGNYAILIIAATAIVTIMEKTGGSISIANTIIQFVGKKKSPAVITAVGSALSACSPSEAGFIIFAPLTKFIEKKSKRKLGVITIALATGIYTVHAMIPPSFGPLTAAGKLNADIWSFFLIAIIASGLGITASYFWCKFFISADTNITDQFSYRKYDLDRDIPSFRISILPIVVPILLITMRSLSVAPSKPFGSGKIAAFFEFSGDPSVAMLIGLLTSLLLLKRTDFGKPFTNWMAESIEKSSKLIIIACSAVVLADVLTLPSLAKTIYDNFIFTGIGLLLPFLISAAIKIISGSPVTAIITASTISAAFIQSAGLSPLFTLGAVAAGSVIASHANDPYFWVVSQHSDFNTDDLYKYFTTSTIIASIASFITIWLMSLIF